MIYRMSNVKYVKQVAIAFLFFLSANAHSVNYRQVNATITLDTNWKFCKGELEEASQSTFDDSDWESVTVPHDWAIYGPFDKEIDKQVVKIVQNKEKEATEKTGRTGALPFIGKAWYRRVFSVPTLSDHQRVLLTFDGAMSNAKVYVNGQKVGEHAYGYSYFYFDVTQYVQEGQSNVLAVCLENEPFSSRWYPGAGLYRKSTTYR